MKISCQTHSSYSQPEAYLVVVVIVCYFHPIEGTQPRGEVHWIKFSPNFVSTFPVQVFAYTCAQNVRASCQRLSSNIEHGNLLAVPHFQRNS